MNRSYVILLVLVLCCATFAGESKVRVGTYYYPWYDLSSHTPYQSLRGHLVPKHSPALGNYNSSDSNVIGAHIEQSLRANISFWAVSWWGPDSPEDKVFREGILMHEYASQLKYAILYESDNRLGKGYSNLISDFDYFRENYFNNPNYLKVNGKPVVFIYLTRDYFRNKGGDELASLRKVHPNIYLVGDDVFGPGYKASHASKWDAVTAYDVYGQSMGTHRSTHAALEQLKTNFRDARKAANSVNVGLIPAAAPGFNDKGVRSGHDGAPRYFEDDPQSVEGDVFRAVLREVVLPQIDPLGANMIMITSFNEWHEDTQIEPTAGTACKTNKDDSLSGHKYTQGDYYTDYGNLYLDILRQETKKHQ